MNYSLQQAWRITVSAAVLRSRCRYIFVGAGADVKVWLRLHLRWNRRNSEWYVFSSFSNTDKRIILKNVFLLIRKVRCCKEKFMVESRLFIGSERRSRSRSRRKQNNPEPVNNGPASEHWSADPKIAWAVSVWWACVAQYGISQKEKITPF